MTDTERRVPEVTLPTEEVSDPTEIFELGLEEALTRAFEGLFDYEE